MQGARALFGIAGDVENCGDIRDWGCGSRQDAGTAEAIQKMGATHTRTSHGEVVIDNKYKVVTTPCYMLDATIDQIGEGAENVIDAVLKLI